MQVPGDTGTPRTLDKEIDIISGVSGGSFTAAAYASKRDRAVSRARGALRIITATIFLTHDYFLAISSLSISNPGIGNGCCRTYGTNDEMAKIYADVDFSSDSDKLFARSFSDLAKKGGRS